METIKLGIVGLGRAGRHMHLAEIADINKKGASFKIVAVCDTIEKRRLEVARECACKQYATIEELVKDEEVQMVDIATRSSTIRCSIGGVPNTQATFPLISIIL